MSLSSPTPEAYSLFHNGSLALAKMESNGVRIDVDYLDRTIGKVGKKIAALEEGLKTDPVWKAWKRRFGTSANMGSLTQLGEILYGVMKLPVTAWTTGGSGSEEERKAKRRPKVDEEVLSHLDLPFAKDYLSLSKLKKLKSTYLEGVRREVVDGFLHPVFNLSGGGGVDGVKGGAESYRGSSSLPNAQNIPIRNPQISGLIRKAFIARPDCRLISRDFSGIEVRVAACVTKDPVLIKYLTDPTSDMHRDQAMNLYLLKKEEVGRKTTRDASKNRFVFPQFYGQVYFNCAPSLWEACGQPHYVVEGSGVQIREHLRQKGIIELGDCEPGRDPRPGTFEYLVKQAERDMWDNRFTVFTAWKKKVWAEYQRRGWTRLVTGFVCRGLFRRNQVLNQPIQGPAFHCLLWALTRIQKLIEKYRMKTKLVLQIHDDLIADVPEKETQDYLELSDRVMTKDLPKTWPWLIVPIETEVEATEIEGDWWGKKTWERNREGLWGPKPLAV